MPDSISIAKADKAIASSAANAFLVSSGPGGIPVAPDSLSLTPAADTVLGTVDEFAVAAKIVRHYSEMTVLRCTTGEGACFSQYHGPNTFTGGVDNIFAFAAYNDSNVEFVNTAPTWKFTLEGDYYPDPNVNYRTCELNLDYYANVTVNGVTNWSVRPLAISVNRLANYAEMAWTGGRHYWYQNDKTTPFLDMKSHDVLTGDPIAEPYAQFSVCVLADQRVEGSLFRIRNRQYNIVGASDENQSLYYGQNVARGTGSFTVLENGQASVWSHSATGDGLQLYLKASGSAGDTLPLIADFTHVNGLTIYPTTTNAIKVDNGSGTAMATITTGGAITGQTITAYSSNSTVTAYGSGNPAVYATSSSGCSAKIQALGNSTAYIGTESSHSLNLITANTARITINAAGAISLVGTTTAASVAVSATLVLPTSADASIPNGGIAWSSDNVNTLKCRTPAGDLKTITLT